MEKFTREVTFLSNILDAKSSKFESKPVKKRVSFLELSQSDPNQAELTFCILSIWEDVQTFGGKNRLIANPKLLLELTYKIIDTLLITDENFTITDKTELKNDNFAVMALGEFFLNEKITPFFLRFHNEYRA